MNPNVNEEFIAAVQADDSVTLKKLREICGLTADEARKYDNAALREAALFGHHEVLKELREGYGLTADDARKSDNVALQSAALFGHHEVLKELRLGYGLTAEDARTDDNWVLRSAACNGHLEVLKELHIGYGLTADDARAVNNYALQGAAWRSDWDTVVYMVNDFCLEIKDIRETDILQKAIDHGKWKQLAELADKVPDLWDDLEAINNELYQKVHIHRRERIVKRAVK